MESNNNATDAPFVHLLSMGYSEMYIQRAIKVHKKSKFGTNWRLSVLVQIIDRLQAIDWKNEKEYHSNLLDKKSNHQHSESLHLLAHQPSHHNVNSDISDIYEHIESLYMKAVSLYENKHYEECERVLKDVLRRNPNHCQAAFLYKDLVEQRLNWYNCNPEILKQVKPKKNSMLFGIVNSIWKVKKKQNTFKKSNDSDHPCRFEFRQFLKENIQLDKYYDNLQNKFVCAKYDDIRILKDFDAKMLETEIGLKPLHCKLFMKKVEIFIGQIQIFRNWLADFVDISTDLLLDCLENNGILTLDTLYRRVKCIADLDAMINNNENINNENISSILWNEMESYKCRNKYKKKHIRSKTMEIHNHKKQSSDAAHWGFTKGDKLSEMDHNVNNKEKLSDDQFIAALSPSAKSIDDMFMSFEPQLKKIYLPTLMLSTPMSISSYHSSDEKEYETAYI